MKAKVISIAIIVVIFYSCSIFKKNTNGIKTIGHYTIDSIVKDNTLRDGKSQIIGKMYDKYTNAAILGGIITMFSSDTIIIYADTNGFFQATIASGNYNFSVLSGSHDDISVSPFVLRNKEILYISIYMGSTYSH